MSVATNIVTKLKQLAYNAGSNSNSVDTAVDQLMDYRIAIAVPTAAGMMGGANLNAQANDTAVLAIDANSKLVGCNFSAATATTNTAADDIVITVRTNGATAATYNSNAAAQGACAANGVVAFSVNTTNSFVDAGESITITYTMADVTNNYLDGTILLTLRPQ